MRTRLPVHETGEAGSEAPSDARRRAPIRTFVTLTGQRDNVGDSLLRRCMLHAIQQGGPCAVYVGRGRGGYISNLGVGPDDQVYDSLRPWLWALVRSVLTQRTNLVMNSGELTFDRRYALRIVQTLPLVLVVKLRGGAFVQAGVGVRHVRSRAPRGAHLLASMADVATWRDQPSRSMVGVGEVQPDWAFAEGTAADELARRAADPVEDPIIAISVRRDGWLPTKEWLAGLAEVCEASGARPVVVCQVRRDVTRSVSIASTLGAELVTWNPDVDHRTQEEVVREVYRRATWVVSNRLHVLIAAVTEGAAILPYVPDQNGKLTRSLAAVGIDYEHVPPSAASVPSVSGLAAERMALARSVGRARAELARQSDRIGRAVGEPDRSRIRVLHSLDAPGRDTRYRSQMAATASDTVEVRFFSWPMALFGRYDVFHVHWPEHLVNSGEGWRGRLSLLLATLLVVRLRLSRIPVVRTLHNLEPHDTQTDAVARFSARLDALAVLDINLVAERAPDRRTPFVHIPHGGYREPFAEHPAVDAEPGRVVLFGMLKAYKGIDQLLTAFADTDDPHLSLRFVGMPVNREVARQIERAAERDPRISARLEFVSDADLVKEVTQASLAVLPYRAVYSSGVALAALSLDRPLLITESATGRALAEEVGEAWVRCYEPPLTPEVLVEAVRAGVPEGRPDLSARDWSSVARAHEAAYRRAISLRRRGPS